MDAELEQLREKSSRSTAFHHNPVFQHQQRAGTARDEAEATEMAARVAGEMAAEADQERLKIESLVQEVEKTSPGSDRAKDAQAAEAQAEKDGDEAIAASLDSDVAAEGALNSESSRRLHRPANPEGANVDEAKALQDESVAGRDLSDLDSLEKRVSDDLA
jgi:hypothetical protein